MGLWAEISGLLFFMLSAVVMVSSQAVPGSGNSPADAVARTLGSLVPAAVEGVLRDVTIAALNGMDSLERIADHAGCGLIQAAQLETAIINALRGARDSSVLLIRAGRAPETGFPEEIAEFLGDGGKEALLRERPQTFLTRLFPGLAPPAALIAPRDRLVEIAAADFARMAARLGRATTLRNRARLVD